jgi:multiple sugar transport system permease protein
MSPRTSQAPKTAAGRLRRKPILAKSGLVFGGAAIAAWSFFPIYWMVLSSLRTQTALFAAPSLVPANLTLDSYRALIELSDYPKQFLNSLTVAAIAVAITAIISIPVAYALTRFRVPGKRLILVSILYAYMFPPLLLAIPMYAVFVRLGIADTLIALAIAHCTLTLPLANWLLWGFLRTMPFELEEAARVDGCTRLGSFFRIILPLCRPGLITVAIFTFLLSWTDYIYALVIVISDENKTLPLGIASMIGAFDLRWGEAMAGATLIAAPLVLMFLFLSRSLTEGIAAGAMKG